MSDPGSIRLGYGNVVPAATLGGSGWDSNYPIENLQEWPRRARGTGTSVTVTASFGSIAGPIIAIGRHNLTSAALVSVTAGGWSVSNQTCDCFEVPSTENVSSVSITISDPGNPDGYISLGKLFIGTAFRPTEGADWNGTLGAESGTIVTPALSGTEFFDEQPTRRTWRGTWSWLTPQEAYTTLMGLQMSHGISRDVCIIPDVTDTTNRWRSFVGRLRQLSEIEWPYLHAHTFACEVIEHI